MKLTVLVFGLAMLASESHACYRYTSALFPHIWDHMGATHIEGVTDGLDMNDYENFYFNETLYTVFDNGAVVEGNFTDASILMGGDIQVLTALVMADAIFVPLLARFPSFNNTDVSLRYERLIAYSADQYDLAGKPIGAYVCLFAGVKKRLITYEAIKDYENVDAILQITWLHNNSALDSVTFQILLAVVGDRLIAMYNFEEGRLDKVSETAPIVNSLSYFGVFGYTCANVDDNYGLHSNHFCGIDGSYVYPLDVSWLCPPSSVVCSTLSKNPLVNSMACNRLLDPHDTCEVKGYCQFTSDTDFEVNLLISADPKSGNLFEVVSDTDVMGNSTFCNATVEPAGDYWSVEFNVSPDFITECGVKENGNGSYSLLIHAHDGDPMIYNHLTRHFNFTCNPSQLVDQVVQGVHVGDFSSTSVPERVNQASIGFALSADPLRDDYKEIEIGGTVRVGTPIHLWAKFEKQPSTYRRNVDYYGIYVKSCMYGSTPLFDDKIYPLVADGCSVISDMGNFAYAYDTVNYTDPWLLITGPFKVFRWIGGEYTYLQCKIGLCVITGFNESKCFDSCTGTHVNSVNERTRRQAEQEQTEYVLTAHLRVVDSLDGAEGITYDKEQSCVEPTMAYVTVIAMVIMLLVASIITAMLFLKMQARKLK